MKLIHQKRSETKNCTNKNITMDTCEKQFENDVPAVPERIIVRIKIVLFYVSLNIVSIKIFSKKTVKA